MRISIYNGEFPLAIHGDKLISKCIDELAMVGNRGLAVRIAIIAAADEFDEFLGGVEMGTTDYAEIFSVVGRLSKQWECTPSAAIKYCILMAWASQDNAI